MASSGICVGGHTYVRAKHPYMKHNGIHRLHVNILLFHTKDLNFCGFWNLWKVLLPKPHFYYGLIPMGQKKKAERFSKQNNEAICHQIR